MYNFAIAVRVYLRRKYLHEFFTREHSKEFKAEKITKITTCKRIPATWQYKLQ